MKPRLARRLVLALATFTLGGAGGLAPAQTVGLLREVFTNIPGNNISDLTSAPSFPDRPARREYLTGGVETGPDEADNYGQRLRGFLLPPATGDYVFWIASDDQSVLYLSPDDDPGRRRLIAAVNGYTGFRDWFVEASQQSTPIRLEEGRYYYFEAMQKEGGGGDHLSVRWTLPGGIVEEPMSATYFVPLGTPLFAPEITRQPGSITVVEGEMATFLVEVRNSDPVRYQWNRNGVALPGATRSSITLNRVSMADDGARFRCTLANDLGVVLTEEAVLRVLPDTTPPALTAVYNVAATNVLVRFSEWVGTNSALLASNYALDGGVSVTAVHRRSRNDEVLLETSPLTPGTTYTLLVTGVTDRAATPNPVPAGTRFDFVALGLVPGDVGRLPVEPVVDPVAGGLDITSVGRGLGGTNDQVHFSHQARTGDFDVELRVASLQGADLFAQAGLMVRQSLASGSAFAASLASPASAGSSFRWRASTGTVARASGAFPGNYPDTWLRLRRVGTNFSGFASYDGVSWSSLGAAGIAMSNTVLVGVVTASRSTNAPVVAAFRDFRDHEAREPAGLLPSGVEPLGPSSRRTGLVLSEILYHAPDRDDGRALEFVEVFNGDSVLVELDGYRIAGDIEFEFPRGTVLPAGGFLLVAQAPEDLGAVGGIGADVPVLGPWAGRLPRDQGWIQLRNRAGAVLLEVNYTDDLPWPVAAGGAGNSLVLARPSYGEGDVRAWAASERRGGSPGTPEPVLADPRRGVRLNEVLARTDAPQVDYLELYNASAITVDLTGCVLTDNAAVAKYRLPPGTLLAPGGHRAWTEDELGFALSSAGEAVFLLDPEGERVIDAVRFGPQLAGVSSGRTPDGGEDWGLLAGLTPGAPNGPRRPSEVILNEIMYNPPGGESEEYVELLNRSSQPVALRGWRLMGGIDFTFTEDRELPAGGMIVVAADVERLRARYPDLGAAVVGNFSGSLRNSGERIALARPDVLDSTDAQGTPVRTPVQVIVEEVTYRDGGRWGRWSDGGGSSLERIDPEADGRRASNWADSDESGKGGWIQVETTGVLELGEGAPEELHLMLLGDGECLIDDVEVLNAGGANLVGNSGFEGGLAGWIVQGNHVASGLGSEGFTGRRSLHLRASAGGDNGANLVKVDLTPGGLTVNGLATLRARVRWLRGHSDLLLRLKGNYLETTATLAVPAALGTPGAANSRRVANAGPAIWEVGHAPVVPAALEPVRVTARVSDPQGIGGVHLRYRFDPSVTVHDVVMRDDGRDGDLVPGDGVFSGLIPGQAAGVLVAFWIEAGDRATPPVTTTFPAEPAAGECLVRFGDEVPAGTFGTYRLWMTQARTDVWTAREVMSNEALDGTIVYGTARAIYNGGARYRGSPFIRPGYDSPTGSLSAYVWTVPKDEPLLGSDEFNLDWLEQPGRDATLQRERMSFWVGEQLGVNTSHARYIKVYVNGVRRGLVYTDSQQPNGDYVTSWYPDRDEGEIFKIDDWFEFNDAVQREFNVDARLEPYLNGAGQLHKTRYRWNWEKKSNRGLNDDYSSLLTLVDALNRPDDADYTRRVSDLVDLDGWLGSIAVRRAVADWDGYGYDRGKNTFAYLPPGGRWNLMLWDLDFSLGGGSDGPATEVFTANDPTMERMYAHPYFGRVYLQALNDVVRGPFAPGRADPLMDANYAALTGNDVTVASPSPIKSWIASRRSYLVQVLATNTAPWAIDPGPPGGWQTDEGVVHLTGTAPIEVRTIAVNGSPLVPEWRTRTQWVLRVPLRAGTNRFTLAGLDRHGASVAGATSSVDVVNTGPDEPAEAFVRVTEIDYEPADPDAEFIEIHNGSTATTYDLSGWRLEGVDFVFPGGTLIAPGEHLLTVKDRRVFEAVHGQGLPVVGEYPGRLNNAGEALSLVRPGSGSQPPTVVNAVAYSPRAPWPVRAAGGGGSLQVLDAAQDNRRPSNWLAVDGAGHGHARWQFTAVTGRATTAADSVTVSLSRGSEVWVDDVSLVAGVVPRVGPDLVQNGGFEAPLAQGWTPDPGVAGSAIDAGVRRSGAASLRLVTQPGAGSGSAAMRQALGTPLVPGQLYTLSFWSLAGPLGGDLTVRLAGGGVAQTVDALEPAVAVATPGAASAVRGPVAPFPDLWINEVLPPGPGGVGASWIELYNGSDTEVNLSGWFLSPDPGHPGRWAFPSGARLGAGEFLVVDAGGTPTGSGGWRTDFALTPATGSVVLARTADGVPAAVDVLHYDGMSAGRSAGSFPDGAWLERRVLEVPTPGGPNDPSSLPVRLAINEWMSRNNTTLADPADGDFDDWFEIYNGGAQAVDLSGYTLTDDPAEPRKTVIPPGFLLAPGAVMLVWADGEPEQNGPGRELHADFALSADGEVIALFSPGGSLVDLVEFAAQGRDVSHGLVPDGAHGNVRRLERPSPRALNAGMPPAEILITGVQATDAGVRLTWTSVAGRRYQVQFSEDLDLGWIHVGSVVVATGPATEFIDGTPSAAGFRFYRVIEVP